jgi:hypothetical protein
MLPLTSVALRLTGFRRCQLLLTNLARRRRDYLTNPEDSGRRSRAVARMVRLAAVHGPWRPTCLTEALVLWSLLSAHGLEGDLRIGVQRSAGAFQAHAWVTLHGIPLSDDGGDARFVAFGRPIL